MQRIFKTLAPFICIAAGILFIVLGFVNVNKQKNYPETTAVITAIETEGTVISIGDTGDTDDQQTHVYVTYSVNAGDYEAELGEYSASMKVGDEVSIRYNPDDPSDIVKSGAMGSIVTFAFGALAIVAGIVLFIKRIA